MNMPYNPLITKQKISEAILYQEGKQECTEVCNRTNQSNFNAVKELCIPYSENIKIQSPKKATNTL